MDAMDGYTIIFGKKPNSLKECIDKSFCPIGLRYSYREGNPNVLVCGENGIVFEYDPGGMRYRLSEEIIDNEAEWRGLYITSKEVVYEYHLDCCGERFDDHRLMTALPGG